MHVFSQKLPNDWSVWVLEHFLAECLTLHEGHLDRIGLPAHRLRLVAEYYLQFVGGLRLGRVASQQITIILCELGDSVEGFRGHRAERMYEAVHDGIRVLVFLGSVQHALKY